MPDDDFTLIDLDENKKVRALIDALMPGVTPDDKQLQDDVAAPPEATPDMFPGLLGDIVEACCENSEAVPVAVAANLLAWFSAHIGRLRYLVIDNEERWLNNFYLLVGPSGLGKGSSGKGPARIFRRVQENLELTFRHAYDAGQGEGLSQCPLLKVHRGGLSSSEGLGFALNDGEETEPDDEDDSDKPKPKPTKSKTVTDKRLLIIEGEMGNTFCQFTRQGNTLSMGLRNAYDGVDIEPMTKRDQIKVTDPYICLVGNITAQELMQFDEKQVMSFNGVLNRILVLWMQPGRLVANPPGLPIDTLDRFASLLAERLMLARNRTFETHYRNLPKLATVIAFSEDAKQRFEDIYPLLMNPPDCDRVLGLTRRHRLHARILAVLLAMLEGQPQVQRHHLDSALAWVAYSRKSVIHCYRCQADQQQAENRHTLAKKILYAIVVMNQKRGPCTRTDIFNFCHNKETAENISRALETLLNWMPPLIRQTTKTLSNGRTIPVYQPTPDAIRFIDIADEGSL